MIDIKQIRQEPEFVIGLLESRGFTQARELVESIAGHDTWERQLKTKRQALLQERNLKSSEIGLLNAQDPVANHNAIEAIKDKVRKLNFTVHEIDNQLSNADVQGKLLLLPNLPDIDTPDGLDESGNEVEDIWVPDRGFTLYERDHVDLGTSMESMDFETAVKIAGPRHVVLSRGLARLERVLGQWMLDENIKAGYEEVQVPVLVNRDTMVGTGQLPKFEEDLYKTTDGQYLIPTAEVSLTNLFRDTIQPDGRVHRLTALTPCFRAEAGSAGRDTRGMIRQHQFNKVELVAVCGAEGLNEKPFDHMIAHVHNLLQQLELPHRWVALCKGDMGFSAAATVDFEVWMPSQHCYREISSVSYCGQFQARRMNARYRGLNGEGKSANEFLHTFNGSGLAVGRTLVAVMENYQLANGGIAIPRVLWGRMGGKVISPKGRIVS